MGLPFGSRADWCPVRALRVWTKEAAIERGALFRHVTRHGHVKGRLSGHAVAKVVKRCVELAGLEASRYSGHSLRAGLVSTAICN